MFPPRTIRSERTAYFVVAKIDQLSLTKCGLATYLQNQCGALVGNGSQGGICNCGGSTEFPAGLVPSPVADLHGANEDGDAYRNCYGHADHNNDCYRHDYGDGNRNSD